MVQFIIRAQAILSIILLIKSNDEIKIKKNIRLGIIKKAIIVILNEFIKTS